MLHDGANGIPPILADWIETGEVLHLEVSYRNSAQVLTLAASSTNSRPTTPAQSAMEGGRKLCART